LASGPLRLLGEDAGLSLFLFLLVASVLLDWPLRPLLPGWIFHLLLVVTLVVGVLVVELKRTATIAAAAAALIVAALHVAGAERTGAFADAFKLGFYAIFTGALLLRAFKPGHVTVHRLLGAVAAFLLLAVDFGIAFQLLEEVQPGSLTAGGGPATPQDAIWMSFVTITTLGYGDVLPVSAAARSVAAMEALTGILFPAILIGKLVGEVSLVRRR
jgi:hypothetical protein